MGIEELLLDQAKREGFEKGKSEMNISFIGNLLSSTDFDTLKISQLAGVSEAFVYR